MFFLFGLFILFIFWSIWIGFCGDKDVLVEEFGEELNSKFVNFKVDILWLIVGLILLIISLCILVWGVVEIVIFFGVSDVVIGFIVIVIGMLLFELVLFLVVVKKGEYDMVLGNVIGLNMFNILVVVGIVGVIYFM